MNACRLVPFLVLAGVVSLAVAGDPPTRRGRGRSGPEEAVLLELYTSQG